MQVRDELEGGSSPPRRPAYNHSRLALDTMGQLSSEAYIGRQQYAADRAADNARIVETAIEDGAKAREFTRVVDSMTTLRHDIHTTDTVQLASSSESDGSQLTADAWEMVRLAREIRDIGIVEIEDEKIKALSSAAGRTGCTDDEGRVEACDLPYYDSDIDGDDWDAAVQQYAREIHDIVEAINSAAEAILREIDSQLGTSYCPSGASRI